MIENTRLNLKDVPSLIESGANGGSAARAYQVDFLLLLLLQVLNTVVVSVELIF